MCANELKRLKPEDIVSMKNLGRAVISPDGKWAAFVVSKAVLEAEKSERISHIWLISIESGKQFQLTNGANGDGDSHWSPDSQKLAFVSKRYSAISAISAIDDKNQIWIISIAGGEARQLTYTKNGASNPLWSPDGKQIAFMMPEKDSEAEEKRKRAKDDPIIVGENDFKQTHLWLIDVETMNAEPSLLLTLSDSSDSSEIDKSQRLTEGNFHVSEPSWSPDGKQIASVLSPSPKADDTMFRSVIHIVDLETKKLRKLTEHHGGEGSPRWSPDGKEVAFLYGSEGYGQKELHIISSEGGISTNLTSKNLDRNVDNPTWSPDGKVIYFGAMDHVRRHLYSTSKDGGEVVQLTQGDSVITGISIADDGDTFLCCHTKPDMPVDLWVGSIKTGNIKQLTELNPQIRNFALGETRIIHYKSGDGLEIEGLLCLPVGYEEAKEAKEAKGDKRSPLILEPHGGPRSSKDLSFNPQWQYFAGEGFAVFAPNFRGGDGYGRSFAKLNFSDWGVGDYQDIMAGVDYLVEKEVADAERLVVGGWSYGGYMTAWIIAQTDRFKAAFCGCGVYNLISMYGQTDIPTFMRLYFSDGAPVQQLKLYQELSPANYINHVKTPTLILHGEEDKRVPLPQGEEFYASLKSIGVDVEFVKYPREGHGIGEPRHWIDAYRRQVEWYKRYIH